MPCGDRGRDWNQGMLRTAKHPHGLRVGKGRFLLLGFGGSMVLLTQYISIILSHPICGTNIKCNVKIINEVFGIFFLTKSLKSSVYFTLTTRPSSDATCQMLGSHVWLLTTDWTEN